MKNYARIKKGPFYIGRDTLPTGTLVQLDQGSPTGDVHGRTIRRYNVFSTSHHIHLYDDQVEDINFEPSKLYNHAVMVGFNADPRFFENGVNAILERIYWMNGPFNPMTPMDCWLEWYVRGEDEARLLTISPRKEMLLRISDGHRRNYELLDRLKGVVEKYNQAGTIENFNW